MRGSRSVVKLHETFTNERNEADGSIKINVIESMHSERNDAVPVNAGAMRQVTNIKHNAKKQYKIITTKRMERIAYGRWV